MVANHSAIVEDDCANSETRNPFELEEHISELFVQQLGTVRFGLSGFQMWRTNEISHSETTFIFEFPEKGVERVIGQCSIILISYEYDRYLMIGTIIPTKT
jgi:hypothetical protein